MDKTVKKNRKTFKKATKSQVSLKVEFLEMKKELEALKKENKELRSELKKLSTDVKEVQDKCFGVLSNIKTYFDNIQKALVCLQANSLIEELRVISKKSKKK